MTRRIKHSDEVVERARLLHDAGLGYKRISLKLGVSRNTLKDWLTYRTR